MSYLRNFDSNTNALINQLHTAWTNRASVAEYAAIRDRLLVSAENLEIEVCTLATVLQCALPDEVALQRDAGDDWNAFWDLSDTISGRSYGGDPRTSLGKRKRMYNENARRRNLAIVAALWSPEVVQFYEWHLASQGHMNLLRACAVKYPHFREEFRPRLNAVLLQRHCEAIQHGRARNLVEEPLQPFKDFNLLVLEDISVDLDVEERWVTNTDGALPVDDNGTTLKDARPNHFTQYLLRRDRFGILSTRDSPSEEPDTTLTSQPPEIGDVSMSLEATGITIGDHGLTSQDVELSPPCGGMHDVFQNLDGYAHCGDAGVEAFDPVPQSSSNGVVPFPFDLPWNVILADLPSPFRHAEPEVVTVNPMLTFNIQRGGSHSAESPSGEADSDAYSSSTCASRTTRSEGWAADSRRQVSDTSCCSSTALLPENTSSVDGECTRAPMQSRCGPLVMESRARSTHEVIELHPSPDETQCSSRAIEMATESQITETCNEFSRTNGLQDPSYAPHALDILKRSSHANIIESELHRMHGDRIASCIAEWSRRPDGTGRAKRAAESRQLANVTAKWAEVHATQSLSRSVGGSLSEEEADLIYSTAEDFLKASLEGKLFRKVVIIKEAFSDSGLHTPETFAPMLRDVGTSYPVKAGLNCFAPATRHQEHGAPTNQNDGTLIERQVPLVTPNLTNAHKPLCTMLGRYRLLDVLVRRCEAETLKLPGHDFFHNTVTTGVNVLAECGGQSQVHINTGYGVWLRNLHGVQFGSFVPLKTVEPDSTRECNIQGVGLDSLHERLFVLEEDDVLFLPPNVPIIYTLNHLQPTLIESGIFWDNACIVETLQSLRWACAHKVVEPTECEGVFDLLSELEVLVDADVDRFCGNRAGDGFREILSNEIRGLRSIIGGSNDM